MSRLSFQEDGDFSSLPLDNHHSDPENGEEGSSRENLAVSSYALMGIGTAGLKKSGRASKNRDAAVMRVSATHKPAVKSAWSDEDNDHEVQPVQAKSVPLATKKDATGVSAPITKTTGEIKEQALLPTISTSTEAAIALPVSKWLKTFLMNKKDPGAVPEPPEIVPLDDTYISQFSNSTRAHLSARRVLETVDIESEEDSDMEETGLSSSFFDNDVTDHVAKIQLKFFNLPFTITAEEIEERAEDFGVRLRNVVLSMDKATNRPRGMASGELVSHLDSKRDGLHGDVAVAALVGKSFGGRPVRVEVFGNFDKAKSRRSSAGEGRYFAESVSVSVKCNACGGVGHKAADCMNTVVVPCHLCARLDHDPADCPNLVCYQCGEFGHHSKDCFAPYNMNKATLCTACGGATHDRRACPKRNSPSLDKLEGPTIRCMICHKWGHASCRRTKRPYQRDIFCPNCGKTGHHIDFPELGYVSCGPGGGGYNRRYSDHGGGGGRFGINYNSGGGRDAEYSYDKYGNKSMNNASSNAGKRSRPQSYSSDSSDDFDEYVPSYKSSSRGSGRTVVVDHEASDDDYQHERDQSSGSSRRKRSRHSY